MRKILTLLMLFATLGAFGQTATHRNVKITNLSENKNNERILVVDNTGFVSFKMQSDISGGNGGDLSNYYTKSEVQGLLADYYTESQIDSLFNGYYTKVEIGVMLNDFLTKSEANSTYEPKFTKNTAFNKNFGIGNTDVARGNHTHEYSTITGTPTKLSDFSNDLGNYGNWLTISDASNTYQEKLTAGNNISIVGNVISATGGGNGGGDSVFEETNNGAIYPKNWDRYGTTYGDNAVDLAFIRAKRDDMGANSFRAGRDARAAHDYAMAFGYAARATGRHTYAFGQSSEASGTGSYALGIQSKALQANTFVAGRGVESRTARQIVLGSYNDSGDSSALVLGVGTANNNRKNGLTIDEDGLVRLPELTNALINSGDDKSAINKGYLTSKLSNHYTKTEALNQFVGLNGVQTIADTKTYSSSPIVPSPTLGGHAANKDYVDGKLGGGLVKLSAQGSVPNGLTTVDSYSYEFSKGTNPVNQNHGVLEIQEAGVYRISVYKRSSVSLATQIYINSNGLQDGLVDEHVNIFQVTTVVELDADDEIEVLVNNNSGNSTEVYLTVTIEKI